MNVLEVKKNIRNFYNKKEQSLYALSIYYAALALNYFRSVQPPNPNTPGKFWTNRTGQAAVRVFSNAELTNEFVRWFMAHGVQYGVYLELANDRRNQALRPVIHRFVGRFFQDAKKIYGGSL